MRRFPAIATVCTLLTAGSLPAQEEVLLRYRFTAGDVQSFRLVQDVEMDAALNLLGTDQRRKIVLRNALEWSARGLKAGDADARVALRLERVALEGKVGEEGVRFDTRAKDDEQGTVARLLNKVVAKVLDKDFEVELSGNGELRKVEGLRRILEDAGKELGLPDKANLLKNIDEAMAADIFVRAGWPRLPREKVKVGSTWKQAVAANIVAAPAARGALVEAEYTLKAVEVIDGKKVARIAVVVRPDAAALKNLKVPLPLPQLQGVDVTLGVKRWESDGEILFEIDRGRLLRSKIDTRLELVLGADLGGNTVGVELKYDGRDRVEPVEAAK